MPGCGRGAPPAGLGRNWAQTEAQGGWWGPGSAAGGGAAASPRLLFRPHNIKVGELQQAFAALRASSICAVVIFGISTKVGRPCVGAKTAVADHSTGGKKNQVTCT